jgi:hypothetical protein
MPSRQYIQLISNLVGLREIACVKPSEVTPKFGGNDFLPLSDPGSHFRETSGAGFLGSMFEAVGRVLTTTACPQRGVAKLGNLLP